MSVQASELFSVKGLVAVITGGGTGIGLMMTKALALNGAHKVYILGRRKEKLDEACALCPNIVGIVADVTSKQALLDAAAQIKAEVGYVNFLAVNSGAMGPKNAVEAGTAPIAEYAKAGLDQDWDAFDDTFKVNVAAALRTSYAFLELLDEGNKRDIIPQTKSQIVVTTSIAGYIKAPGASLAYKASKAAATVVAKVLGAELVPYGIRVNTIAPGIFPSDMSTFLTKNAKGDPTKDGAFDQQVLPATRTGTQEEMAGTVLYLASRAGAYLNGLALVIDGGRLTMVPSTY